MDKSLNQRELRSDSGEITLPRRFVKAATAVQMFKNAPAIDADRFRADVDAWAGQDTRPRA